MHPHLSHRNLVQKPMPATAFGKDATPRKTGRIRPWLGAAWRRWQRHKMIAVFRAMDDYLLRDIGIERHDIERVVDGFDARELRMTPVAPIKSPRVPRWDQDTDRKAA